MNKSRFKASGRGDKPTPPDPFPEFSQQYESFSNSRNRRRWILDATRRRFLMSLASWSSLDDGGSHHSPSDMVLGWFLVSEWWWVRKFRENDFFMREQKGGKPRAKREGEILRESHCLAKRWRRWGGTKNATPPSQGKWCFMNESRFKAAVRSWRDGIP